VKKGMRPEDQNRSVTGFDLQLMFMQLDTRKAVRQLKQLDAVLRDRRYPNDPRDSA
jgi:hypothetical protein